MMGLSAGKGGVSVIVTDVLNLFEVRLQKPIISLDEWAIIFLLNEIESRVIGCSHFAWSFHGGCPF